jgi:hypothetical protein
VHNNEGEGKLASNTKGAVASADEAECSGIVSEAIHNALLTVIMAVVNARVDELDGEGVTAGLVSALVCWMIVLQVMIL